MNKNVINFHKLEQDLFENEEFIELLGNFSTAGLKKIKTDDQLAGIYKKFDEICCKVIDAEPHNFHIGTTFSDKKLEFEGNDMIIFSNTFTKTNPFLMLEKYFEGTRYNQQVAAVKTNNKNKGFTNKEFEKISACYDSTYLSYIDFSLLYSMDPLYMYQPHIIDAREYACNMMKKTMKTFNKHYKANDVLNYYVGVLFNDEHRYYDKNYTERAYTKVLERKKAIDDTRKKMDKFITEQVDFSKINEVSDEALYCLMSPTVEYFYRKCHDPDNKLKESVLNEYLKRLFANYGFEYKEDMGNKINVKTNSNMNYAINEFQKLIANEFDEFVKLNPVDLETQRKVKLNIYKDRNGMYINLFPDGTIEGYWQPYSSFIRKYVAKERNKMIYAFEKTFKDEDMTKQMKDYFAILDMNKIKKYLEKLYDMPIKEIENVLLNTMIEGVILDINEKQKENNLENYLDMKKIIKNKNTSKRKM